MTVIKKDIYAGLVREKFDGKVKMLQLATDMGKLEGIGQGEKITFPKWSLIGDATDMVKGDQISTEELQQTEQFATIKQIGKGVMVYDSSNLTSLGNQIEEGATQSAMVMARKIDADLIEVAKTAPFQATCADPKAITSQEIENALLNFGDERDMDEFTNGGIVINSLLIPSFYAMPEFTNAGDTTTVAGNGLIRNGLLGYYRGIKVFISDKGTFDSATGECITFIVKNRALGYKFAKEIDVELEREASYKRTNVFSDALYAVALVKEDGVVIVKSSNV